MAGHVHGMAYAGLETGEPPNVAGWAAWHQFPSSMSCGWTARAMHWPEGPLRTDGSYVGLERWEQPGGTAGEGLNFKISFFDFVQQLSDSD